MNSLTQKITLPARQLIQSTVIKNFLVFSFGSLLRRGISIITAPIMLSILSPADYGLLALANSFISITAIFIGMGLRQSFQLEYFHATSAERKQLINDNIFIYLLVSVPLFIILIFYHRWLNYFIFVNNARPALIMISLIICFVYFFVEFFYQVLKYQCRAAYVAGLQLAIALLTISLNILFLWYLKWGVISVLVAQLCGMLIVSIIACKLYFVRSCFIFFNCKRSIYTMRMHIMNGLMFIPSVLLAWILSCGDRWVLAHYSTLHNVGIYSLANTFGRLFHLLVLYPMTASYIPHLLQTFTTQKNTIVILEKANQKTMYFCMISVAIIITVGFFCTKSLFYTLLPSTYHEAINYIWLLLMGYIFLFGTYFSTILIQFQKKRIFMAFALVAPTTLNIILNILLVPYFAIYGCVIATLFAYASYFALTVWYNKKLITRGIKAF